MNKELLYNFFQGKTSMLINAIFTKDMIIPANNPNKKLDGSITGKPETLSGRTAII